MGLPGVACLVGVERLAATSRGPLRFRSAPPPLRTAVLLRHGEERITGGHWATIGARSSGPITVPSFDVVSELNAHEVANGVDQANRELAQRFDFKDTGARFELEELTVTLHAQVDFQLKQMLEVLK